MLGSGIKTIGEVRARTEAAQEGDFETVCMSGDEVWRIGDEARRDRQKFV
jgi:hypothetical protein